MQLTTQPVKACRTCGTLFTKKRTVSMRSWNTTNVYCSRVCADTGQKRTVGPLKKCSRCKEERTLSDFHRNRSTWDGYASECKPCLRARRTQFRYSNPEEYRKQNRENARKKRQRQVDRCGAAKSVLAVYDLTEDQFIALREKQGNRCSICGQTPHAPERFHIDHDHATGAIRGLLCRHCNSGLGFFKDDVGRLAAAIGYLSRRPL